MTGVDVKGEKGREIAEIESDPDIKLEKGNNKKERRKGEREERRGRRILVFFWSGLGGKTEKKRNGVK